MTRNLESRPAFLAGAASAGALAGHSIAYVLAVRNAGLRDALLMATGHRYWPAAVAVAAVAGAFGVGSIAVGHFGRGLRLAEPAPKAGVFARAGTLAGLQVGIFLIQESLERLAIGSPISAFFHGHLLLIGLGVQVGVAFLVALLLGFLASAAEAAGRALATPARRSPRSAHQRPRSGAEPASRILVRTGGIRAPPEASLAS